MAHIGGFISAPIKLAALISDLRLTGRSDSSSRRSCPPNNSKITSKSCNNNNERFTKQTNKAHSFRSHLCSAKLAAFGLLPLLFLPLLIPSSSCQAKQVAPDLIRHHTHYMNIVPSTHFHYKEGRQLSLKEDQAKWVAEAGELRLEERSGALKPEAPSSSHIYKRSSALISSSAGGAHYPPLVGTMQPLVHQLNPLSRRMMSEAAHTRWTSPRMVQPPNEQLLLSAQMDEQQQVAHGELLNQNSAEPLTAEPATSVHVYASSSSSSSSSRPAAARKHEEADLLLRQKQHIQYHDQWPSMAGKCHKRTLNFCASVLPFNTTTFPNIIGDTNRFEVKRSLPFFGFLAKSTCNKRLDELLCLLLEPPCAVQSGLAIPPCKKFCRLALEGCNEYIPATLAMSSVFDCRQYPDSNDPGVCINLAQGSKCDVDEFKCPDKTCIPRNWLCDGVRDCIFAADEANCTAPTGVGLQTSVCSTEEFKCDGKCVPKAWKCDGERDCLDGTDEEACDQRPRCGPDRFKCADGNGCLPKRWVCDGKAECRDGSDELNCEQLECSENDFKCDNGICIPKLWRCDRQADCKDGSDERNCVYPAPSTTAAPTTLVASFGTEQPAYQNISSMVATTLTTNAPDTTQPTPTVVASLVAETTSQQHPSINQLQQQTAEAVSASQHHYAGASDQRKSAAATRQQQLELDLSDDSSPAIHEYTIGLPAVGLQVQPKSGQAASSGEPQEASAASQASEASLQQPQHQLQSAKELKKFDYDIIQSPSSAPNLNQINGLLASGGGVEPPNQASQQAAAQLHTQVDFVAQQQGSLGRQQLPASPVSTNQHRASFRGQQHPHDARSRTFGQVIKTSKWANGVEHQAGQQQQPHPIGVERVPIYRSLFKTLKGGGRALGSQGEHGRYSGVAVRRRRDRQHQLRAQQALSTAGSTSSTTGALAHSSPSPLLSQTEPDLVRSTHWTSVSPQPEAGGSVAPAASRQQQQQQQQPEQIKYPAHVVQPVAQSRSHSVASYLQLLQSRYNLRLPRVSSQPLLAPV